MLRPRTLALTALVVAAAGCSSDETSGPATGGVGTPPVQTLATTTTTIPETTTSSASTTTSTPTTEPGPTTTEVPGRREPTGRTVAVFASTPGDVERGWVPLGGWTGNDFVGSGASNSPQWTQGREIRVTRLGTDPIGSEIGPDRTSCAGTGGPQVRVPVGATPPPGSGFGAVAVEGVWPLRPRPVVPVDADVPAYVDAARELLQGRAPRSTPGDVVQIVLADMNGNGEEMSVVVFESEETPADDGSGFALVLGFDNQTGRFHEIDSDVVDAPPPPPPPPPPPDPDDTLVPGASTTSSTSTTTTTLPPPPPLERFRVLDVADLNGDRVYELVTKSWTDEAHSVQLHELVRGTFREVGESTCER